MSGRLIISRHKSWHVWNADNVERVERDEALAAEGKAEEEKRARVAEGEVRLQLLRKRAQKLRGEEEEEDAKQKIPQPAEHLDLFADQGLEEVLLGGGRAVESGARERRLGAHNEKETKSAVPTASAEEKFGAVEKHVPWYLGGEEKKNEKKEKADLRTKEREDPLFVMSVAKDATKQLEQMKSQGISMDEALVTMHQRTRDPKFAASKPKKREAEDEEDQKKKKKERKSKKRSKDKTIDELRAERVAREAAEHERARQLLQPPAAQSRFPTGRARSPTRYNSAFFK